VVGIPLSRYVARYRLLYFAQCKMAINSRILVFYYVYFNKYIVNTAFSQVVREGDGGYSSLNLPLSSAKVATSLTSGMLMSWYNYLKGLYAFTQLGYSMYYV